MKRITAALLVPLLACATVAPVPAQVQPPLPPAPVPGLLYIDVTDGPSQVATKDGRECTTPCALELPQGQQQLTLRQRSRDGVGGGYDVITPLVLPEPQGLRLTLSRVTVLHPVRRKFAIAAHWIGEAALLAAMITWRPRSGPRRAAARGLAGAGGALFLMSIPLGYGTIKRTTGSWTQFPWLAQPVRTRDDLVPED